MANGVVLDKPGKPFYVSPSSFHIIVLLQTVSKILDRVVASRLSAIVRSVDLLHLNQSGSLPSLSAFDACTALADTLRTLQRPALQCCSLFLDIRGEFDNVDADICLFLRSKVVNYHLLSWVRSVRTGRSCRLLFQGSPTIFSPVSVGTLQGSPVSPLLCVMYVAPVHIPLDRGLVLSYVDDFSVTVSSLSYGSNSRILQLPFRHIRAIARSQKIDISVPKTELIHWHKLMQRDLLRFFSPLRLPLMTNYSTPPLSSAGWAPGSSLTLLLPHNFPGGSLCPSRLFFCPTSLCRRERHLSSSTLLASLLSNVAYPVIWR